MAKTVISVDLKKAPKDQELPQHNRWHPDIPPVVTVKPGDRLILMAKSKKARRNFGQFDTQGYVDGKLVFEAIITGMVLPDR